MKKLALSLIFALTISLAACGAEAPPTVSGEPLPEASAAATSWNGKGACYTAEPVINGKNEWMGCSFDYAGESFSLVSAEDGTLRVLCGGKGLFDAEGDYGLFMRADESGLWLVSSAVGGLVLRLYSPEGGVLMKAKLPDAPRDMLLSDGRAWLDMGGTLLAFAPDGSCEELDIAQKYRRVVRDGEGGLHTVSQIEGGCFVTPVGGGEGFSVERGVVGSGDEAAFLYLAGTDGVYKLDSGGETELFIDFAECRIELGKVLEFDAVGGGRFMSSGVRGTLLLRPASPDEIGRKTELTLAVFCLDSAIEQHVARFNALSDDYTIKTVNYTAEAGGEANARLRLNTELGSGRGPDMICFPNAVTEDIGPLNYVVRGMFEDLTPWIDAEIGRSNLMVWDALSEYGGVYVISDGFSCKGMKGLREVFGDARGWTIQDYLDMEASLEPWQDMCYHMDPAYFIEMLSRRYMRTAIDWESGTCNFDNPEFIAILEAAARVKEDRTAEHESLDSFETAWSRMGRGQLMVSFTSFSDTDLTNGPNFDNYYTGKEVTYFGYPSTDGEDGLFAELDFALGICVNSEHKEAYWDFVRDMLLNSGDPTLPRMGLPLYRPAFEAALASCIGEEITQLHSEEEVEKYRAFIESADSLSLYDGRALAIIMDEANAFLSGGQSAGQAAKLIQERMSIYVAEQS
ncbi:MAG: hypothetical protein ACLUGA_11650 [Oscillospiraceae bacterium]